jgi:hypothetical protein
VPDDPTTGELLAQLLAIAREQVALQRSVAVPAIRAIVEETLTKTEQRRAYELADGTRSGSDVAAEVGTTKQSVSNWMRRWRDLGIAYETEVAPHNIRHIASLKALGLSIDVGKGGG